ncbi:MAG: polysaccharide deacetylase family protein [Salibacteraceae bacterium]
MSSCELLFYSPRVTPRLSYISRLFFEELLGLKLQIVEDQEFFKQSTHPHKLSYCAKAVGEELNLCPQGLLVERGLNEQTIHVKEWNGLPIFFLVRNAEVPFDPLAASFFLVTRYEEYLPHKRDIYNRFDVHQSVAYRHGFLDKPLVNLWAYCLRDLLKARYPALQFKKRKYRFVPTIDVDNAYAYLEKGFVRTSGAYLRSIFRGDFQDLRERSRVLIGADADPYDTFDLQLELQKQYDLKPIYFFLVADYGVNDKNVPITSRRFQSLIKGMNDYAAVGIHPSFGSNSEPEKLKEEIKRLSNVLHAEVTKSRQHFLKLHLPETYRQLIHREITDDYSMGYAAEMGFRASICDSFLFFDLDREVETSLRIHPFCIMEATLRFYKKVAPEKALAHFQPIVDAVKAVDGTLMALWHNDSLSEHHQWVGWRELYEETIKLALPSS